VVWIKSLKIAENVRVSYFISAKWNPIGGAVVLTVLIEDWIYSDEWAFAGSTSFS
jgi:hypothetical protein